MNQGEEPSRRCQRQWLLTLLYDYYPPATLDEAGRERSVAIRSLTDSPNAGGLGPASPSKRPSVRALRKALVAYHRTRTERSSLAYDGRCTVEVAKLASLLTVELHE